ncbi:DUF5701 family protein [Mariniluteicoccus flavus]
MTISEQVARLGDLGVPALAGLSRAEFDALGRALPEVTDGLVVVNPALVPAADLAPLLSRDGLPGFVVEDMVDLAEFVPLPGLDVPEAPLYLVTDVDRGDDLLNWTPADALPELTRRGRTPLTISEGIGWLLQEPGRLEPNRCFMCIGSRKPKARGGFDARTPALWISGGTGRDGRARKGAPKVGWCWHGNRHTWLGFASGRERVA